MDRFLVRLGPEPLDAREAERFVAVPSAGGLVVFTGVVRNRHGGREVLGLDYEALEPLARTKLAELAREALRDPGVQRVAAFHRTGSLAVGEASVVVAASAVHREEAFRAARLLIDRIKEVLPVWKRERFADGSGAWVAGSAIRESDRARPAREAP